MSAARSQGGDRLREYSFDELRSSRILYDRDPPPLMFIALGVIIVLLGGIVLWACVNEKTEVVNTSGIVSVEGREYYSSSVSGTVVEMTVMEGMRVSEGDVVMKLDAGDLVRQLDLYRNLEQLYKSYADGYSVAIQKLSQFDPAKSVGAKDSNRNPFDSEKEQEFYSIYQVYLDSIRSIELAHSSTDSSSDEVKKVVNQAIADLNATMIQYQAQYEQLSAQERYYGSIDSAYEKALKALNDYTPGKAIPVNPFTPSDFLFLSFQNTIDALDSTADDSVRTEIKKVSIEGYNDQRAQNRPILESYSAQASYYSSLVSDYSGMIAKLNGPGYGLISGKNPYQSIDRCYPIYQTIIDSIEVVKKKHSGAETLKASRQRAVDQAIAEMSMTRSQYSSQYSQNRDQAALYQKMVDDSSFTSYADGYVHFQPGLEKGSTVTPGQMLFTVSPELGADNCIVTVYLPSVSRAYVSEGDEVEITFPGIDKNDYGNISGTLESISSDSSLDSSGNLVYECKVRPEATEFTDGRGKTVKVIQGMPANVGIHYEQATWFDWAVRMLGLD